MKVLITGTAGFIGAALVKKLLTEDHIILGVDNHNNYYSQDLKENRIKNFYNHSQYTHSRLDIADKKQLESVFNNFKPEIVVNLAAQAGVRYSLSNPQAYINSNIIGFANILECSKNLNIKHLIYASSSSVYGDSEKLPLSEANCVDHPLSLYAATKKSNELMAHSYSHLYKLQTTGLRFFTVYGPWGRPDMAYFKFTKNILEDKPIDIYNGGNHKRDFTYIDDIVEGVSKIINKDNSEKKKESNLPQNNNHNLWNIYNIGNSESIKLIDFIEIIENKLGKKATKNFLPMQLGDVKDTYADIANITREFNFHPKVSVSEGIGLFIDWYKNYFIVN
tara:strand:+ start:158 stop:1162 length:1005 start_codon:yes stop_codon:yes gene_type:complete